MHSTGPSTADPAVEQANQERARTGPVSRVLDGVVRDPRDALLGGLCSALARGHGYDPLVARTVAILLALSNGLGLVLYTIGWALTPELRATGPATAPLDRIWPTWRQLPERQLAALIIFVTLGFTFTVGSVLPFGWGPALVVLLIATLATLVQRQGGRSVDLTRLPAPQAGELIGTALAAPAPLPAEAEVLAAPRSAESWTWSQPPTGQASAVERSSASAISRRARLALATAGTAMAGAAGALTWRMVELPTLQRISLSMAAALAAVALVMLVSSGLGRSAWLIVLGLVLSVGAIAPLVVHSQTAEQVHTFSSPAALPQVLEISTADTRIDLNDLNLSSDAELTVRINAARVLLDPPRQANLVINYRLSAATILLPGGNRVVGLSLPDSWVGPVDPGRATLTLNLELTAASLEVR